MNNNLLRMDNVGIVVESLDKAIEFFTEIGLIVEGRTIIEGSWAGRVTGLGSQKVEIAMLATPDGHSRIEISRFIEPESIENHMKSPVNSLGYLRIMFEVNDIEGMVQRLLSIGATLDGEIVQYEQSYRLCYIRSSEGILVGLVEKL